MEEFSLNNVPQKIYHSKTKNYFREVKSSYENQNYRSVIVGLYSVVLCDIIYKLQDLRDKYNDKQAEAVLNYVEESQKQQPNNSGWEEKLIEKAYNDNKLFSLYTYTNIKNLREHRHLCAHPVLEDNYNLFQPNQEISIAHIRNIVDGLLTNPPLATKKIFDEFIVDIAKNKDVLYDINNLRNYIEERFLKYTSLEVRKFIFYTLWKFCYKLNNEDCNVNRNVNARALRLILERDKKEMLRYMSDNKSYFSLVNNDNNILFYFIGLIAYHPEIYNLLNEDVRILVNENTKRDDLTKAIAWFLNDNIKDHIKWIKDNSKKFKDFSSGSILPLLNPAIENGISSDFFELIIYLYTSSSNIEMSQYRYNMVLELLPKFNFPQIANLLNSIEHNAHLSSSKYRDYNFGIRQKILAIDDTYDFSNYPKFLISMSTLI